MIKDRGAITESMKGGGEILPEGVSFDGSTDYLSRSSDLVGNTDSKQFTFSCWVYHNGVTCELYDIGYVRFLIYDDGHYTFILKNSSSTIILTVDNSNAYIPLNTWSNILISVDLTDVSKRHMYINDNMENDSVFTIYTNDTIKFTNTSINVFGDILFKGRGSNLFLDYTYRDLSIEANRRLFITADGKPADGLGVVGSLYLQSHVQPSVYSNFTCSISTDGRYLTGYNYSTDKTYKYTMSTPYDLTTATGGEFNGFLQTADLGMFMRENRMYYFKGGTEPFIYCYTTLNFNPYKETLVGSKNLGGVSYPTFYNKNDGTMWVSPSYKDIYIKIGSTVFQFYSANGTLSDITYTSKTFQLASSYLNFCLSDDGTKLFSTHANRIRSHTLSTPFDLSTCVYDNIEYTLSYFGSATAIVFTEDGTKCFLSVYKAGVSNPIYYRLEMTTPFDLTTAISEYNSDPQQPILYLPMKDAETAHINDGYGGNFVQNGTLATADRGANQDNCKASKPDGSSNSLTLSPLGVSAGKTFTFNVNINTNSLIEYSFFEIATSGLTNALSIQLGNLLRLFGKNSAGTLILSSINDISAVVGRTYNISISCDMSNSSLFQIYVNGNRITPDLTVFIDDNLDYTSTVYLFKNIATTYAQLNAIGELYFDTNYIDLATNNPFWDSETNKPIPVRKAMANLGSNPLICSPISADNPTANYGSGGQWTLNGGGLVGARSMSEYIARSAHGYYGGSPTQMTNFLEVSSISGLTNNFNTFSLSISLYNVDTSHQFEVVIFTLGGYKNLVLCTDNSEDLMVYVGGTSTALKINTDAFISVGWKTIFISYDGDNIYTNVNNDESLVACTNQVLVTNKRVSLLGTSVAVSDDVDPYDWSGEMSSTYFTTDYIDFSQESNRNLFVNQLGYPRDLRPEIEAGNIPTPLIYLPFDDTDNLGKNLGTGGDFTVNGTVTAGADFSL